MDEEFASSSARKIMGSFQDAHRELRKAVTNLGADAVESTGQRDWSLKEMLGHIAFWQEAAIAVITGMFRDGNIEGYRFRSGYVPDPDEPWPAADIHNAREAEWARSKSSEAVLARLDEAHRNLVSVLKTVTEAEAKEHKDYFDELTSHLREHLAEIQMGGLAHG